MLTTPPGTSEVARTSARVTAASGRVSEAMTTATLPLTMAGASRLTSPSSEDRSGATSPTTPVGSGMVKLKNGPATGFALPRTWPSLSAQPAYQTQRSMAPSTTAPALARVEALACGDLGDELVAPALHQLGDPVEDLAPVHRRPGGPRLERLARGPDRVSDVLSRGAAGVGQRPPPGAAHEVGAARLGPGEAPPMYSL